MGFKQRITNMTKISENHLVSGVEMKFHRGKAVSRKLVRGYDSNLGKKL